MPCFNADSRPLRESLKHNFLDKCLGDQPPHQPLRIFEIMFAPPRSTIRERLRQVQTHMWL